MGNDSVTSDVLMCEGHATLPKYVFVLSLENRSFDHLFGRYSVEGKDAVNKSTKRRVNGVLLPGSTQIDPQYTNTYNGTTYGIPNDSPPKRMPGDPKHEYEHILCQSCGPAEVQKLFTAFAASFDKKPVDLSLVPPPRQSAPTTSGSYTRPAPDNSGFIHSWAKSFTLNVKEGMGPPAVAGNPDSPPTANIDEVMRCFNTETDLPTLTHLANEFVLCDNFFSSLPGPTGPNRFFMMAGSSAGYDNSPASLAMAEMSNTSHLQLSNGHIFKQLTQFNVPWHIFGDDGNPMAGVLEGVHNSAIDPLHGASNKKSLQGMLTGSDPFPYNFVWIEPDYDTTTSIEHFRPMYSGGNSMHPCSDVDKSQQLIQDVYAMIRGNDAVWKNCVLFITWDEHGGFYDHVIPPAAPPPNDTPYPGYNQWGFDFSRFGVRVPTLVVSPLTDGGLIDGRQYDHTSILKTVMMLYNKGAFTNGAVPSSAMVALTDRIAWAADFLSLFSTGVVRDCTVALNDPDEPSANPVVDASVLNPSAPPSGNLPLIVASTMNVQQQTDPSFDPKAAAAQIQTTQDAIDYLNKANAYLDSVDDSGNQAA